MIARLVLGDLVASWRLWAASWAVMTAGALVALVCAADFSTAATLADPVDAAGLRNHALVFSAMNGLVVLVALTVLVSFTVQLQRRTYALWQLSGVGPSLVLRVVVLQALLLAAVSLAVALAGLPWVLDGVMTVLASPLRSPGAPALTATLGVPEALVASGAFAVVVVASALGAGRSAARTPLLTAVREPDQEVARPRRARLVTTAVTGAAALALLVLSALGAQGPSALFLVPAMASVVAGSPWAVPWLLERWTRLVPSRSDAWFLARRSALHHASRSQAAVSLLAVTGMLGSLTGLAGVWDDPAYYLNGLALFGTPVALVLVTGAATVAMTTRGRRRDTALLVVGGGTASLALRAAVLEALVVVVTAALVVVPAAVVSIPGTIGSPLDTLRPLPALLLLGAVVMVAVTVAPVLSARRGPVVRHLADA